MKTLNYMLVVVALTFLNAAAAPEPNTKDDSTYSQSFDLGKRTLKPRGVNDHFIPLQPGRYLLLTGEEEDDEGGKVTLTVSIQVLRGTKKVDGVKCAIIREMEWENDELVEVSWNYFAICKQTKAMFYFGEDVDDYEDGEVVGHGGAWLAGENGNKPGLIMPGLPLIGSRYFQEVAPGIALDRAEHLEDNATVETPAGTFTNCLVVAETTPLNPDELSLKSYAPGVGLIHDDVIRLVDYGRKRRFDNIKKFLDDDNDDGDDD